ncbi:MULTISPECIES: beta-3-deoxy-D-manno-oct-2-ulosonic acid transferase [unclassified Novosphingobium]|uniref:capsular polysaccharide export protein, LipB/KpsS family n=1 Tax=unclassified Novosphingobium TaxID=2644732 RepID=UPI00146B1EA3|nr:MULTISPECIES: beta-3-deoxy-D-manno-oct-2-ulosonic acid transferase [unclassified Novosphingobium]NMN03204.1 capsular polysaccharide export protein [Novosphingobium sp. SG919]NMN86806.1 capsular polysaccharide export protein [Novosphingobium sp. SG916]
MSGVPLLRAPPFPWADATVALPQVSSVGMDGPLPVSRAQFADLRAARVGGCFWAPPVVGDDPIAVVLRPGSAAEVAALLAYDEDGAALWLVPQSPAGCGHVLAGRNMQPDAVDPWSVLDRARLLVAHGDDEWIALARIAGVAVKVLSPGRFGAPGDSADALDARAALALAQAHYRDPFGGGATGLAETIDLLATWRAALDGNRSIAVASGMAWWKKAEIRRFLWHPARPLRFARTPARALALAERAGAAVAIWPSRVSPGLIAQARQQGVPLVRVEDGFVRSVGLGVDLVPPSSVVVDALGIHFDPAGPSDLEAVLANAAFSPRLLARARALRETIVAAGISKYAADTQAPVPPRAVPGRRLVLVPGQVEDDMSVRAGGHGLASNLELVRRARLAEPDAEIWFRPHPDVDAGHRKGAVPDAQVLAHADRVVRGGGMAPLLDAVDAVHVLTSLAGFEALLRGREVVCHGTPFYAGWGLTRDLAPVPDRRGRALSLDALVAGVLILYPRYLDPVTGLPCPPEVLVGRMAGARATNRLRWIAPLRRIQGRLMAALR